MRAAEAISRGSFVCEYVGEILNDSEANERGKRYLLTNYFETFQASQISSDVFNDFLPVFVILNDLYYLIATCAFSSTHPLGFSSLVNIHNFHVGLLYCRHY